MEPKGGGRDEVPCGPLSHGAAGWRRCPLCDSITPHQLAPSPGTERIPQPCLPGCFFPAQRPSSPLAGPAPLPAPHNPTQRGASQRITWLQEALAALPENSVPARGSHLPTGHPRGQGPQGAHLMLMVSALRMRPGTAWALREMGGRKGKMEGGRKEDEAHHFSRKRWS